MAGQGRWPFRTAWFQPGQPAPLYKSFLWGDRDDAEVTAFTDWYFEAAAGGGSGPVGLATETDTSLALSGVQIRQVGLSTETDAALALSAVLRRAVGLATETDTAFALSSGASGAVGLASETDTAFALSAVIRRAVGLASETDTAFALTFAGPIQVGMATETDTALALSAGAPSETGAVFYFSLRLVSGVYESGVTSTANRGSDAWIPAPRIPIGRVQPDGFVVVAPEWRRFFDTMADRLGGVQGPRLPDVATAVETTQATVQQTTATVSAVAQQSQAIAEAVTVITEVNQNAALAGADQIPPVPRGLDQFIF